MDFKYPLKYRTFDQLFEDVTVDLKNYTLEGKIEPQTLLKIARRCNYELGFRIYKTRQIVLEIEHGKTKLPDDFHILNFAFVCGEWTVTEALPQGTNIEERLVAPAYTPDPGTPSDCTDGVVCGTRTSCNTCTSDPCACVTTPDPCTNTCLTKCGEEYQLIQKINTQTRTYKQVFPLYLTCEEDIIDCECPNMQWEKAADRGNIRHGWLYTNFDEGKVYINYQGDMIDDDGNILVPDHEQINEFYEYALKQRILENLLMNGTDVGPRLQLVEQRYRAARNNAMSIVNMPNFAELKKLWQVNRKAQYANYYDMFSSYGPIYR